ncbi:MAG: hypothetical protein JSW64_12745 [Candidatus Zixiibacteriota bacterium]|nr:MAG: hypothetical protein JSW64_12745 [candidate division Zixibacteria bacterium]
MSCNTGKCALLIFLTVILSAPVIAQQVGTDTRREAIPLDPVDAILDLFDSYSIVALGEGHHTNWQGATFRLLLVRDPRFSQIVNDIVVEFGTSRYQDIMDRYISGEMVLTDSVRLCWRETTQPVIWDAPIYEEFFRAVRTLNRSLPIERRLRILLADPPIDWSIINSREELEQWYYDHMPERSWGKVNARDGHAVDVVEREVLAKGRKALAIFGDAHFNRAELPQPMTGFMGAYFKGNFVQQLERMYPGSVFCITSIINADSIEIKHPEILSWPKPSLIFLKNTAIGSLKTFGPFKLEETHDALLWVGLNNSHSYSSAMPEIVENEEYYLEALRRDSLWIKQYQDDLRKLRSDFLGK